MKMTSRSAVATRNIMPTVASRISRTNSPTWVVKSESAVRSSVKMLRTKQGDLDERSSVVGEEDSAENNGLLWREDEVGDGGSAAGGAEEADCGEAGFNGAAA